jgi:prevent-host-death family protein
MLYDQLHGQESDMSKVNLADAKAQLSKLVERAQAGERIAITKRGKPVACLVAADVPRKPIARAMLRALTAAMPPQRDSAADVVRAMRDSDRF